MEPIIRIIILQLVGIEFVLVVIIIIVSWVVGVF